MNESDNKIKIVKGKVSQAGYEDTMCSYIKAFENRNDSLSDKALYIVENMTISDTLYAITPNVTEALNRSTRKTIGIMNSKGELVLPIINSDIVKINSNYIAVKTTSSIEELELAKSDSTRTQENMIMSEKIKNKILGLNPNARFICDDYYGTYDLYEIKDNGLTRVSDNISYIATNNDTIYLQTNRLEDEVQVIGKKVEDPNLTMPVDALADVTNKPLDNLGELPDMPLELPGAPELNKEQTEFNVDEMQKELASFKNELELDEPYFEKEKKLADKPNTVFYEPEIKSEFEIENKKPKIEYEEKYQIENTNINDIVIAVKTKMEENNEIIEKLKRENIKKDEAIKLKEEELKENNEEMAEKDAEINRLKIRFNKINSELKEKDEEMAEKDAEINRLNSELNKKDERISNIKEKYREDMKTVIEEFSGILNDNSEEKYYNHSIAA